MIIITHQRHDQPTTGTTTVFLVTIIIMIITTPAIHLSCVSENKHDHNKQQQKQKQEQRQQTIIQFDIITVLCITH
jgi:hypothetical protein